MAEKHKVYTKAVVIIAVLAGAWYLLRRSSPVVQQQELQQSPWVSPFYQNTPGINDQMVWQATQPPTFNSTNTLNYYDGSIQGLANQYIPMFGLVGMTAVAA